VVGSRTMSIWSTVESWSSQFSCDAHRIQKRDAIEDKSVIGRRVGRNTDAAWIEEQIAPPPC